MLLTLQAMQDVWFVQKNNAKKNCNASFIFIQIVHSAATTIVAESWQKNRVIKKTKKTYHFLQQPSRLPFFFFTFIRLSTDKAPSPYEPFHLQKPRQAFSPRRPCWRPWVVNRKKRRLVMITNEATVQDIDAVPHKEPSVEDCCSLPGSIQCDIHSCTRTWAWSQGPRPPLQSSHLVGWEVVGRPEEEDSHLVMG